MSDTPSLPRRSFLGAAAIGAVATQLGATSALAQSADSSAARQTSPPKRLQPLKNIDAGVLNVEYCEARPGQRCAGDSSARLAL